MGRYEIALVLALLNLFTLRGFLPLKQRIDQRRDGRDQGDRD